MAQITVTFNQAVPAPALGYRIRYRVLGTPTWNTLSPNPTSSPVNITVPDGYNWEIGVAAVCSVKSASPEQYFTVNGAPAANGFGGSGYGNTELEACDDAFQNNRTFYASSGTIVEGTELFLDEALTQRIVGMTRVFVGGSNWNITNNGTVISISEYQCS